MPRHKKYRVIRREGIDAGGVGASSRPPLVCVEATIPRLAGYGHDGPIIQYMDVNLGCARTVEEFKELKRQMAIMKKEGLVTTWKYTRVERSPNKTWLGREDVARKLPRRNRRIIKDGKWYEVYEQVYK